MTTTTTTYDAGARTADVPFGTRVEVPWATNYYPGTVVDPRTYGRQNDPEAQRYALVERDDSGGWHRGTVGLPEGHSLWWADGGLRVLDAAANITTDARNMLRYIGEALVETADRSDWCGEFDRRASELIDTLRGLKWESGAASELIEELESALTREREYEVCVHYTANGQTTVMVTAASAEDAVAQFNDDPWAYVDSYYLSSNTDSDTIEFDEVHTE